MHPYQRNGRFYNDAHDSILRRLKNFARGFFYVTGHHILRPLRKKPSLPIIHTKAPEQTNGIGLSDPTTPKAVITWLGHSTFLIQTAGITIITDPVFFGNFPFFSRTQPLPIAPKNLPPIDVVLISHNHKDHMDLRSLEILKKHNPLFLVPMGNKQWLKKRGYENVIEKLWWEEELIVQEETRAPIKITFLPASHWTSRGLFDINKTLWGSWLIATPEKKIYFAGDTAHGTHFSLIAQRLGPIDIALMPIGPNEPRKFLIEAHMNAEDAVQAFIELKAQHFIPMHWGTFERMGAEHHYNPAYQTSRAWATQQKMLINAHLHVIKCGEAVSIC